MKTIPLTQGEFALIDDEDFELVSRHKWFCLVDQKNGKRYAGTNVMRNGKQRGLSMHRLILEHHAAHTDHKDGNGLNNQKENLRPATRAQNGQNRNLQIHSAPFKGVSAYKDTGRWLAGIRVNKKLKYLGYFDDPVAAARAYDAAAVANFGEFARTNKSLGLLP